MIMLSSKFFKGLKSTATISKRKSRSRPQGNLRKETVNFAKTASVNARLKAQELIRKQKSIYREE